MEASRKKFQEAVSKRAGEPDVGHPWPVYEAYTETETDDDIFLDAVVKPARPSRPANMPPGMAGFMTQENWRDAEDRSIKRHIAPLTQHKDLFLKFARHMPNRRVSIQEESEIVRAWVSEYGVLGLFGVDDPRHPGRRESVQGFLRAASDAAMVLELYEAAIPKKPDRRLGEVLERREPSLNWSGISATKQREYALERIVNKVGQIVKDECYPQVYRVENKARQETQGFVYDFGFYSLLGAMYLQMMLLLTDANNTRQCQRPGCSGIIPPGSRKDKVYCSRACVQWAYDNK